MLHNFCRLPRVSVKSTVIIPITCFTKSTRYIHIFNNMIAVSNPQDAERTTSSIGSCFSPKDLDFSRHKVYRPKDEQKVAISTTVRCSSSTKSTPPTSSQVIGTSREFLIATKSKKKLRFSNDVHVKATISLKDISPQERSQAWFSRQEFLDITEECCKQIRMIENGKVLKSKKYCSRGLEAHTRVCAKSKQMTRASSIDAVLSEQDCQRTAHIQDPHSIGCLYHAASASSQLWATCAALNDQRVAEEILEDFHDAVIRGRFVVNSSNTRRPILKKSTVPQLARAA